MSDPELVQDILANIMIAIERIERRFAGINAPDDFLAGNDGIELKSFLMSAKTNLPA